jgi:uncharacterized protein YbaR (Trm112 family)
MSYPNPLAEALALLACPVCHGCLVTGAAPSTIACGACGRVYPVVDDIPVLLADRALPQ